jgi:tetratricopeptide (TPR) repeat protein
MSRIDALSTATKEALRTAAVIGNTFDFRTLQSLFDLELEGIHLKTRLQELIRFEFISEVDDIQEPTFQFRHTLIQEVSYDSLLFSRRRQLHHQVASYLEEAQQDNLESVYEVLVHHYNMSNDHLKTRVYSLKAAEKARQVFAHSEAIDYYRLGLNSLLGKDVAQSVERSYFLEKIGDCYEASGQHPEAVHKYSQALRQWAGVMHKPSALKVPLDFDESQSRKARLSALRHKLAAAYERNSEYDLALKHLDLALDQLPSRQPRQAARIAVSRCLALFRKGQYEDAIHCGRLGLSLSRRTGDQQNLAYAYNILVLSHIDTGGTRRAIRYGKLALGLYEQMGDLRGQAESNNNLGVCFQSLGNQNQALHHFEVALALCERIGNFTNIAIAHNNVGEVLIVIGRLDEAIGHLQKVVETYERKGDPIGCCGLALINLARAYQLKSDYQTASDCLEKGTEILRTVGVRGFLAHALVQQSELQLATSQIDSAFTTCKRALRDAKALGMKLLEARGLHTLGRINMARGLLKQAEANLQQSATLAKRLNANYELGVVLLSLATLYLETAESKRARKLGVSVLKKALTIFRHVGAEADLTKALNLQSSMEL